MWNGFLALRGCASGWLVCCAVFLGATAAIDGESIGLHSAEHWNGKPIPIWLWTDYAKMPGFIELNIESIRYNAPAPMFELRMINKDHIKALVPDMPEEFDRLPYAACISDLIRSALLAHYGGFYFDTDFLVQKPLKPIADKLNDVDFISYAITGQNCQQGRFSSNFIAARPGNPLSVAAWQAVKEKLKQRCIPVDDKLPVCCYTADGAPRKCNVPWAGIGVFSLHTHRLTKRTFFFEARNFFSFQVSDSICRVLEMMAEIRSAATEGVPLRHQMSAAAIYILTGTLYMRLGCSIQAWLGAAYVDLCRFFRPVRLWCVDPRARSRTARLISLWPAGVVWVTKMI
eukprot:m.1106766 g.1106766  ORF g.1106766 m.1106766 type:complete len:344 (+) comp24345_c0_seq20:150-1181(+)